MNQSSKKDTVADKDNKAPSVNKQWGGRFDKGMDEFLQELNASIDFDKKLAIEDITGSRAHANMLNAQKIISDNDYSDIKHGLSIIEEEIKNNNFSWKAELEDVHMNIESRLIALVGDAGKRLHTGRSRNDQVATDIRLWLRKEVDELLCLLKCLMTNIALLAEKEADTIMPGFTHLQSAQPTTFGHHLLAWYEMLRRDTERLIDAKKRLNIMPLGSAAMAGTTFPIDRNKTTNLLGFSEPSRNSLDAVSDRDFAIEVTSDCAMLAMHMSRISEEIIIWNSAQFRFINLPDNFCTGSSIMPQKKNPDIAELVRGKTARVYGNLTTLLTLMKSQPLAYNKDNQEDKEPIFDTLKTIKLCVRAYSEMIPEIIPNRERLKEAAKEGFSTATDLADYLVKKEIPFRDAHEIVGKAVKTAINNNCSLDELNISDLKKLSPLIESDVFEVLTVEGSVSARDHLGGTAPSQVRKASLEAKEWLNKLNINSIN